jgi:hypothetical protein
LRELRRDQQQAPVAAETQRRVMRLRISPTAGPGFDLMRCPGKLVGGEIRELRISGDRMLRSMKWVSNFCDAAIWLFSACRKLQNSIFLTDAMRADPIRTSLVASNNGLTIRKAK